MKADRLAECGKSGAQPVRRIHRYNALVIDSFSATHGNHQPDLVTMPETISAGAANQERLASPMDIVLANPRGFCAGVDRAIEIVERALENFGPPIYVRHEVVHNKYVVDNLAAKGAVFVEDLEEVPDGATVIFSAHGVSLAVREEAKARGLDVYDATCPLVTKVHMEVKRYLREGRDCILIGHAAPSRGRGHSRPVAAR